MGSATERNLHDGQVRLAELRTAIERATKARKSIEALITATRRVADNRRAAPPMRADHEGADLTQTRRSESLSAKIGSLTEAVRRARGQASFNVGSLTPKDAAQSSMASSEQA